ncbi:hypothetical protein HYFRA_00000430 [Hymenoscyphus fraxineus]|uniref:DUF7357 domain-containing protein n=1 Tax=Hymenoscyphus fraxineus TaxID=746836 RepID=A0A9N9PSJ1_9HELO|nr:hypothetical protein HYFRA_00000430 [Hymenoscyphus fraxineus]
MRLRLTVERHALPSTNIIWHIEKTSAPTIHFLLEKVNEVIPIESADQWGLEDYAVELKGSNGVNFECLHFQEVFKVFKEDDEVIIRPLLTRDLKVRRISGRHQISEDGKRLYDGLAFGRPLLKAPSGRPDIKIPPRKRAKLMIAEDTDHDDDDREENTERQMVLHADFEGIDSDPDDNEDFTPTQGDEGMADDDEAEDEDLDEDSSSDSGDDCSDEDDDSISDELKGLQEETEEAKRSQPKQEEAESESQSESEDDISNCDSSTTGKSKDGKEEEKEDIVDHRDPDVYDETLWQIPDEQDRANIRKLNATFPESPIGVCAHLFREAKKDMELCWNALLSNFKPVVSKSVFTKSLQEQNNMPVSPIQSNPKKRSAQVLEDDDGDSASDDEEEEIVRRYDQQGFPPGSISTGKDQDKNSPRRPLKFPSTDELLLNGLTSTPFIDQESVQEKIMSSSDTSSSGFSGSSDEEDLDYASKNDKMEVDDDDTSTSGSDSSGSDSDSSENSDAEEEANESIGPKKHSKAHSACSNESTTSTSGSDSSSDESCDPSDSSDSSDDEDDTPEEVTSKSTPPVAPGKPTHRNGSTSQVVPGTGKSSTQARNIRRRKKNMYDRYLKNGILPAGTTFDEFSKSDVTEKMTPEEVEERLLSVKSGDEVITKNQAISKSEEFNIQRQKLLDSLASGGIEVSILPFVSPQLPKASTTSPTASGTHQPPLPLKKPTVASAEAPDTRPSTAPENTADAQESPKVSPACVDSSQIKTEPARRAKLDLGAGRRMLFQAMGLKNPKTKDDEDKLRKDLMKDIKPLKPAKTCEVPISTSLDDIENEDPEAWREKINYRAVECCQEDVELSEPPFPFKQRWDPQQQSSWSQGGKRKKNQRDEPQYYQDAYTSKNQKRRKGKHNYAEEQEFLDATYEPSYQEDSMMTQDYDKTQLTGIDDDDEVDRQLLDNMESQAPDDLVSLPGDMSSLADLLDGDAKPGMIIAFKIMECSAATNWNPEITPYKTAVVIEILQDGSLEVALAIRDRTKQQFDETGARVYDPFLVVDEDVGDEDAEDDGRRNFKYQELIEPKVVDFSSAIDQEKEIADGIPQQKDGPSADESDTLSHERPSHDEEGPETQLSHVPETVLDSDAPEPNAVQELDANNTEGDNMGPLSSIIENELGTRPDIVEEHEPVIPEPEDQSTPIPENVNEEQEQTGESLVTSGPRFSEEASSFIPDAQVMPVFETVAEEQAEMNVTITGPASLQDADIPDAQPMISGSQDTPTHETTTHNQMDVENTVISEAVVSGPTEHDTVIPTTDTQTSDVDFTDSAPHAQIDTVCMDTEPEIAPPSDVPGSMQTESKVLNAPNSDIQILEASSELKVAGSTIPSNPIPLTPEKQIINGPEDVSTENRRTISHLIREAGFRDTISSSVLKQISPGNIETPDAIVFDRLKKVMSETEQERPYSPEFHGFGSSPSRQQERPRTPIQEEDANSPEPAQHSPQIFVSPPSDPPVLSADDGNDSDWESIAENGEEEEEDDVEVDTSTKPAQENVVQESMEVDEEIPRPEFAVQVQESRQPTAQSEKSEQLPDNIEKPAPVIQHEEAPEALVQPTEVPRPNPETEQPSDTENPGVEPAGSPTRTVEPPSPVNVSKPKSPLRTTKSKSPVPRAETRSPSRGVGKRKSFTMRRMPQPKAALLWEMTEPEALKARSRKTQSPALEASEVRDSVESFKVAKAATLEPNDIALPPRKEPRQMSVSKKGPTSGQNTNTKSKPAAGKAPIDYDSSDSEFPSLRRLTQNRPKQEKMEVCSQPLPEREKIAPVRARPIIKKEPTREVSDDSDESTTKAAKKQDYFSRRSESSKPFSRASKAGPFSSLPQRQVSVSSHSQSSKFSSSQPAPKSASQSQGSQRPAFSSSQPPSQMIDLTLSSDVEPSPPKKQFRKPVLSDDDDELPRNAGKSSIFRKGSGGSGNGLKSSSQSHLNRKTAGR